jgi:hypothetical protein
MIETTYDKQTMLEKDDVLEEDQYIYSGLNGAGILMASNHPGSATGQSNQDPMGSIKDAVQSGFKNSIEKSDRTIMTGQTGGVGERCLSAL